MDLKLYVLVLKNKLAFKVGITERENLDRIKQLNAIYDFDLKNSFLVSCPQKEVIRSLERQILSDYLQFKYEFKEQLDGHTEFLEYKMLESVLTDIRYKQRLKHLSITIIQGVKFIEPEATKKPNKPKKRIPEYDILGIQQFINHVSKNAKNLKLEIEWVIDENNQKIAFRGIIHTSDFDWIKENSELEHSIHISGVSKSHWCSICWGWEYHKQLKIGTVKMIPLFVDNKPLIDENGGYAGIPIESDFIYNELLQLYRKIWYMMPRKQTYRPIPKGYKPPIKTN